MSGARDYDVEVDEHGTPFVRIAGVRAEVVDEATAEQAQFVVCCPTDLGTFPDNVHTLCAMCGRGIVHRPYAPKRPPKICIGCAATLPAERES
jgi:hypothetical protein